MTLASPGLALAGALAVLIPIAIHLFFRRRNQPREWAAMDLLREAVRRSARRRRLQRLLLLAIRCAVVIAAGLAIAGPLLRRLPDEAGPATDAPRELILVLDDGIAQHAIIGGESSMAKSRRIATQAISTLEPGDRVGVVLTSGGRPLVWPPSTDLTATHSALDSVEATHEPSSLADALAMVMKPDRPICVISEFREGTFAQEIGPLQAIGGARLITTSPATGDASNVQVVALETAARGPHSARDLLTIRVKLRRQGGSLDRATTILETRAGEARAVNRVEWEQGQSESTTEVFVQGPRGQASELPIRVSITDTDAQPADNTRFAVVRGSSTIRVGLIDRESTQSSSPGDGVSAWVDRALRPLEGGDIDVDPIDPSIIDRSRLAGHDAVIITRPDLVDKAGWELIAAAVRDGLVVLVMPSSESTTSIWSDAMVGSFGLGWTMAREATNMTASLGVAPPTPSPLLAQLAAELPALVQPVLVSRWFPVAIPEGKGHALLTLENGDPLIATATLERVRGSLIVMACPVDLAWTNLPAKPFMVPLLQEVLRQSIAAVDRGDELKVGDQRINQPMARATEIALALARHDGNPVAQSISLDPNGALARPVEVPGVYQARDGAGRPVGWIVANIDPAAASVQPVPQEEIAARFRGVSVTVAGSDLMAGATVVVTPKGTEDSVPVAAALDGESLALWFFLALLGLSIGESVFARLASSSRGIAAAGGER